MPTDKTQEGYAAIVAEAEAAVASVKDPELRRVAFEKILSTLLERPAHRSSAHASRRAQTASAEPATAQPAAKKTKRGPMAYVQELVDEGFFKKQRTIADVKVELANRGHHVPLTSLSGRLQSLTQRRTLRRQKTTAKGEKAKSTYAYSNW